ncbi:MAG: hypothetical protein IJ827_07030 [Lachnospiraceae bacterium]|nr:hypothetical protein [Lachnospiraceae bacterium]
MTKAGRIKNTLTGLIMIAAALYMIWDDDDGYLLVTSILCIALALAGLRYIFYYLTMARNMVGGKLLLFIGIILLDLGAFTMAIADIPAFYVVLYLLAGHAFAGLVDILRGLEARHLASPRWKLNVMHGAVNIAVAVLCVVFIRSTSMLVLIYGMGLIYSGGVRIVSALHSTAIVYIQ